MPGFAAALVSFVLFDFVSLLFVSLLLVGFDDFDFATGFPRPKSPPVAGFLVDLGFASFEDVVVFALVSFALASFAFASFASFAFVSFAFVSLLVLDVAAFASVVLFASFVAVVGAAGLASALAVEAAAFVSLVAVSIAVGVAGVASFGVSGNGTDFGERMLLGSSFVGLFFDVAEVGVLVFSASNGFVVLMLLGVGFIDAAFFAASAPSSRSARFVSGLGMTIFSFFAAALVDEKDEVVVAGAAMGGGPGFAGKGVKAAVTPSASRISSYSFHSSISVMPYKTRISLLSQLRAFSYTYTQNISLFDYQR